MSQDSTPKKPIDPEIVMPDRVDPDEVIHVPKGSSKARFIMTFLLVIMVLTTFTVSSQVIDVFGGGGGTTKDFMTWKSPAGVQKHMNYTAFVETKRSIAFVMPFVYIGMEREPTDEQTAAFIAMDEAAAEAGIVITDAEMRDRITKDFQSSDNYRNYCAQYRISQKEFETVLRRAMRAERYRDLLAQSLTIPDPKAIETAWKGRHQEFMYDYVELPVATLVESARAEAPKGDALKAWFDALSEPEKAVYKSKSEVSAELVGLSLEGQIAGDALVAKFPRPAGTDAEKEAQEYHRDFGYVRYPKAPTQQDQTFSQPYEAVKGVALIEAPIYHALADWVTSLQAREGAGETVDLAAEAAGLGLAYRKQADPLSVELWKEVFKGSFVGRRTIEVVFDTDRPAGKLWPALSIDEKSYTFGRILEVRPERIPEFSEIASQVESAWADKKAKELALAKLEKVRDAFATRPDANDPAAPPFTPEADEAKFAEAVKAAGLTVQRRDWRDRFAPPPPAGEEPLGDAYIRMNGALATMREQTVAKAELNRDGTTAYLVRIGGVRDPDINKMKVSEFQDASSQQSFQDLAMFVRMKVGSREFLEQRFGVDLAAWHPETNTKQ
ncbi:MAG: hypothetical protein SGI72_02785 [Planctomycetota bacterium]|nr:hypothetical protein [Planctomycetota bacterium]